MMDPLKNLFLAAVGGTTLTYEKADETLKQLVEKGKLSVADGQSLSEDLKRRVKGEDKASDPVFEDTIAENTQLIQRNLEALAERVNKLQTEIDQLKGTTDSDQ